MPTRYKILSEKDLPVNLDNPQDGEALVFSSGFWVNSLQVGPQGDQGATGAQGAQGDTGSQGPQGEQGATGPNEVTTSTSSNITGFLRGTGTVVEGKTEVAGLVVHGATAGTARPANYAAVIWIGSVEPTNATNDDVWFDTS